MENTLVKPIQAIKVNKGRPRKMKMDPPPSHSDIADWIIKNLNKGTFSRQELELLFEFGQATKNCDDILFYPSSGIDLTDIGTVDLLRNEVLSPEGPRIFIHNDANDWSDRDEGWPGQVLNVLSSMNCQLSLNLRPDLEHPEQGNVDVSIVKFKNSLGLICWLVSIFGQDNEDILKVMLTNEWKIKFLYSACDAILNGMGWPRIRKREDCIPGLMYIYFAELLDCQYYMIDANIDEITTLPQRWFENIRNYVAFLPYASRTAIIDKLDFDKNVFCNQFTCDNVSPRLNEDDQFNHYRRHGYHLSDLFLIRSAQPHP